jgi:hypothetical protein
MFSTDISVAVSQNRIEIRNLQVKKTLISGLLFELNIIFELET